MYNEDGIEAMDCNEEIVNPYRTQTFTSLQEWQPHHIVYEPETHDPEKVYVIMAELEANIIRSGKSYNIYQREQKALFLYLLRFKFLKAKPAAERAGINPRTAQGWVKRMKEDPEWDIYDKLTNKVNRARSQL